MHDQAQRLRTMVAQANRDSSGRNTRVITISSGKGGVGKSNFTLNYALALAEQGKKVVILDADVGFANIDVLMGVKPKLTLAELIRKQATLWDILETGPMDIKFIAGGSGFQDLLDLQPEQFDYLVEQLGLLQGYADYVLIDTGAGLNAQSLRLILAADEIYVVLTPEPTSITDAYALIKMVVNRDPDANMRLLVNRAQTAGEGREAADKISLVAERFLNLKIPMLGILPDDPNVTKSVKQQVPFFIAHPDTTASRSLKQLIQAQLHGEAALDAPPKGMKQFLHRMVRLFR
ncbi:MinD/ParA family protein [Tumebacillus sp. ITR2]|uniref:MinD/ParA family protein n=1 Tax=Tumebacillus amylolyticus TaxID=2801339 RepID=A0ABS1JF59_9BACL|nr:MinD/ParA family protein [Tumebacillus amylolyticus]MBL0388930.1 MinD/ParA family protein [Tumebacillus amylolyticus]